jgi:DUF1009 family protein
MGERRSDVVTPIAIICGGGTIPFAVADTLKAQGRPFVLLGITGVTDAARIAVYPHHWVGLGQLGRFERIARSEGCREIVFIGSLKRPRLWKIRFDLTALLHLPHILVAFCGGDDHLLRSVGRLAEAKGFKVIGAHEVVPGVLMPPGVLTARVPSPRDHADISLALQALRENSARDLGQAAVAADGQVLSLEGEEGTDAMLEQLVELRNQGRISTTSGIGVLVKAPKIMQDRRYDLPAIGPRTVASALRAGLAGIAVVAGESVVAELDIMIAAADRDNIFILGIEDRP